MKDTNITELYEAILAEFPSALVNCDFFDNGSAIMDVKFNQRLFVCSFSPRQGYGIDEIQDNEGLGLGYSYAATTQKEAIEVLFCVIKRSFSDIK